MAFRVQAIQGVPYWVGEDSSVYLLPSVQRMQCGEAAQAPVNPAQGAVVQRMQCGEAAQAPVNPSIPTLVPLGRYDSETDTVALNPSWKEDTAPSLLAYRQRLGDYTQEKLKESPPLVKVDKKPV